LHNLSDQEFDRALRDHLEDPGIPYDPASWNKMTRKLDAVFPPNKGSRGFWPLLILTGLVSTVFFWSLFTFSQPSDDLDITDQLTISVGQTEKKSHDVDPSERHTQNNRLYHEQQEFTPGSALKDQGPSTIQQSPNEWSSAMDNSSNQNQQFALLSGSRLKAYEEIEVMLQDSIETLEFSVHQDPPVVKKSTKSPWSIGFGYAPDFSLVGSGGATSPGTNLGFAIEYRLGHRWSLQTGMTYSMKRYKAAGEDYNPPPGFWYYGNAPDNTNGECDVIDIPLNVRYYIQPYSKHRFFISTGLSSYLMLTEDYYYQYDGYPNPKQVDSWSVRNENQHYFGVYNFSAGYQRSLGSRWSLEIEPFIKLPFSGVGFGEVDLWSTGSTFSLKYNFR
jgi:hypothetical protein